MLFRSLDEAVVPVVPEVHDVAAARLRVHEEHERIGHEVEVLDRLLDGEALDRATLHLDLGHRVRGRSAPTVALDERVVGVASPQHRVAPGALVPEEEEVVVEGLEVEHGLVDASTPIQVVANADRADDVIAAMSGVDGISTPIQVASKDGTALIVADLTSDPYSDKATTAVKDVRAAVHEVPGADALTTGMTAVSIDIMDASARDNKVIIPIVLGAVLLILAGLLRSILSPVLLIGTVILSFGAALGISGLVFDLVYGRGHTDPGYPLFAFVFLVALGIDYNIFLMTRVREEAATHGTRRGSLIALS